MLNEFLFTKIEKEEDIGNIWFQRDGATCHTAEATLDVLRPVFLDCRRADVVWPPRRWGAVKDKCYADKPETIDALKDNIREAIDEIQLHTIDNVLKNWTHSVGYCMASRGSFFKGNSFPLLTGSILLSNKKRNLGKYSVVFFFSKHYPLWSRRGLAGSVLARHQNEYEKYFFGDLLSADFWQKLWD